MVNLLREHVPQETRIHYVNPAFRTMFHCGDEKLLGELAAEFVHCDCFERAIAAGRVSAEAPR